MLVLKCGKLGLESRVVVVPQFGQLLLVKLGLVCLLRFMLGLHRFQLDIEDSLVLQLLLVERIVMGLLQVGEHV